MNLDKRKVKIWLEEELSKTKGVEVSNRLDWLDYCLFIFEENYKTLDSYSMSTNGPDVVFEMFKDHDYSSSVHGHFARHLHNFLVSSKSLVEHTRICMRDWYSGTPLLSAYELKVKEMFASDPLASFIEALRNYSVHKSPIGLITHHNLDDSESSNLTCIHKQTLLEWKKLPKGAKEYVAKFNKDIPLIEPVSEYKDKVVEFRQWLRKEFEKYHSKEIYETKWYIQALRFAEEGDFESIFRSGGVNIPLTNGSS